MGRFSLTVFALLFSLEVFGQSCVQIYYDRGTEVPQTYTYGKLHGHYLENLLGHFPKYQQFLIPIESYESGQMERCDASFYIGTYYDNKIPQAFIDDFESTKKAVVWMGYNIWRMGQNRLQRLWDVRYESLTQPDWDKTDDAGIPGFYRFYDYKGETFTKYAAVKGKNLFADYEITQLALGSTGESNVMVWTRHSTRHKTLPYVVAKDKKWFFADSPFSYISLEDRYLIFADLLFDILGEAPRYPNARPALVRFEDVHPQLPLWQVSGLVDAAEKEEIPFSFSLIPRFRDPYGVLTKDPDSQSLELTDRPDFLKLIKESTQKKGSVIFHGASHQFSDLKNPQGVSGVDYEFWNINTNKPLDEDSPEFVLSRVEAGWKLMQDAGIKPSAWLTPHYAASPLDNVMFGQLFLWSVGRSIYYPHRKEQKQPLPVLLTFDLFGSTGNGHRKAYFEDLKVIYPRTTNPGGQFFPYEIYGDVFGQRIIPENVGYIQPGKITVDHMIEHLRRNRVIRDAWGSMFVHPFMVEAKANGGLGDFKGDNSEIRRLFKAAKDLGYEFIDLKRWTRSHLIPQRPPTIEVTYVPSLPSVDTAFMEFWTKWLKPYQGTQNPLEAKSDLKF